MLHVPRDGFIGQFGEVVASPVPLQASHEEAVEYALHDRKRSRTNVSEKRLTQGSRTANPKESTAE